MLIIRGAAEATAVICTAVTVIVVARVLGPEQTGYYAAASTLMFAAAVLGGLGLPSAGAQRIANDPTVAGEAWATVTSARLGAVAVLAAGSWLLIAMIPMPPALRSLLTLMLAVWLTIPFRSEWWLVAAGHVAAVAGIRAASTAATLIVAVLSLRSQSDGARLIIVLAVAPALAAILSTLAVAATWRGNTRLFRLGYVRRVPSYVRAGLSYLSADVSVFVNNNSDRLFLLPLGGPIVLGLYDAAYKVSQPLSAISPVVTDTYFLRLARSLGMPDQATVERRYVDLMLLPTVPFGFFCALFSNEIVRIVYGPAFAPAAPVLAILGFAITLGFLSGTVAIPFTAWNAPRAYAKAVTAGSVTNLVLNALLIPTLHGVGAGIATVAAKLAIVAGGWRDRKQLSSYALGGHFARLCLLALAASAAALTARAAMGSEAAMFVFAMTYLALALVGGHLTRREEALPLRRRPQGSS